MNLVGKILVILILVMSLVFMGMSVAVYATHKNWKDAINNPTTGIKAKLQAEQAKNSELKANFDKLQQQIALEEAAKRDALGKLEGELTRLQTEYRQLATAQAAREQQMATTAQDLESSHKTLASLREQVDKLRDEIHVAQTDRDKQFTEGVKLTDQLNQTKAEVARLNERNVQLAQQISEWRVAADKAGVDLNKVGDLPPTLDGRVAATNASGRVEINLGSDDGLKPGHKLEIFRKTSDGSRYIARVVVTDVEPDRAVAKEVAEPEFHKGIIQKGDHVATRLN